MDLNTLFASFTCYLKSDSFLEVARHRAHPNAFSRQRKLPLASLVAALISGFSKSVQAELDEFFAHLKQQAGLVRHVSEQAFAQARAKLSHAALPTLNAQLLRLVDEAGGVPRWRGLRRIAVDGSFLRFGLRASHVSRAASRDAFVLGCYLPDAQLMLAATLHSTCTGERQALFEQLGSFAPGDLLLLDRGYPARWLFGVLAERRIDFCARVDTTDGGFAAVQAFRASGLDEQEVTLPPPQAADVRDFDCPAETLTVRLVRQRAPDGAIRIFMTSLLDSERFPAADFGEIYHARWSIEEAFKRLKQRLNLEQVSGLSHLAVQQDVAAKVLCDNLAAVLAAAASQRHNTPSHRRINRAYARTALKPVAPLLILGKLCAHALNELLNLIAKRSFLHRPGLSKPRTVRTKPHKHMSFKPC
jgi:hypothetical protein